jgi:hypothetical protein
MASSWQKPLPGASLTGSDVPSMKGYEAHAWPEETCAENLKRAQAEMQAFAGFLKQRWQQGQDRFLGPAVSIETRKRVIMRKVVV